MTHLQAPAVRQEGWKTREKARSDKGGEAAVGKESADTKSACKPI